MAAVCPPCLATLRTMCALGGPTQPELCQLAADYAVSGDPELVARAAALAPRLAWQAHRQLKAAGALRLGPAQEG